MVIAKRLAVKDFNASRFVAGFVVVGVPLAAAGTALVQQAAEMKALGYETTWTLGGEATAFFVLLLAGIAGFVWSKIGD